MVFLIAFVPALVVVIVGLITKSKSATTVAALIAGLVGLAGGPSYALIDLAFVVIAYILAMNSINGSGSKDPNETSSSVENFAGPVYHKGDRVDAAVQGSSVTAVFRDTSVRATDSVEESWEVQRVMKDVADLYMSGRVAEAPSP